MYIYIYVISPLLGFESKSQPGHVGKLPVTLVIYDSVYSGFPHHCTNGWLRLSCKTPLPPPPTQKKRNDK